MGTRMVAGVAVLALALGGARGDTFTEAGTGNTVEGRLLGTVTRGGVKHWLVKDSRRRQHWLPVSRWQRAEAPEPRTSEAAPEGFSWPSVRYRGRERSPRWVAGQYGYFKDKYAWIAGRPVDRRHFVYHFDGAVGKQTRGWGKVARVLGPEDVLLIFEHWPYWMDLEAGTLRTFARGPGARPPAPRLIHVKGLGTDAVVDGQKWGGALVGVGTFRIGTRTFLSCRPMPKYPPDLTPEQFVQMLEDGHELVKWRRIENGPGHWARCHYKQVVIE